MPAPTDGIPIGDTEKFACRVWLDRRRPANRSQLGMAPRRHWQFHMITKIPTQGAIAITPAETLVRFVRDKPYSEMPLRCAEGFTHRRLTVGWQLLDIALDVLMYSAGIGLLTTLVGLLQGAHPGVTAWMYFRGLFLIGLGLGLLMGPLMALPTLLKIRAYEVFSIESEFKPVDFGVAPQQADQIVRLLEAHGVKNQERNPR